MYTTQLDISRYTLKRHIYDIIQYKLIRSSCRGHYILKSLKAKNNDKIYSCTHVYVHVGFVPEWNMV